MKSLAWCLLIVIAFLIGLVTGYEQRSSIRDLRDVSRVKGTERGRTTDPTGRFVALLLLEFGVAGQGELIGTPEWSHRQNSAMLSARLSYN
jgi:hypothetical protein